MSPSEGPLADKTEKALLGIGIGALVAVAACGACAVAAIIVLALLGPVIWTSGPVIVPNI
jgi:hypothetical protein